MSQAVSNRLKRTGKAALPVNSRLRRSECRCEKPRVGWDKLASSAGPPSSITLFSGGPARRSAAGPTLRPFFNRPLLLPDTWQGQAEREPGGSLLIALQVTAEIAGEAASEAQAQADSGGGLGGLCGGFAERLEELSSRGR